ncbi:MAG: dTDP-glucose 4,6-dehydratase [Syntrophobacteraceae bacterium]|nr:dTDP-glucose 4,6-dehydratase [Syntrophobacteraceae bacterium]
MKTWLVTGGAGFIGSNFVLRARSRGLARIINLDLLTYAGNVHNLDCLREDPDHVFVRGDIGDRDLIGELLGRYRPDAVLNFAAESHVDRSIDGPDPFIQTNVVGTFTLLKEGLRHWRGLSVAEQAGFRFLHVSTDEVYGSLGPADPAFSECTPYAPSSPYSASKAAADHLVRAYHHTFDLPTLTTNCSNNYGPRQFPEKLIPLMILNALEGKSLPIYGDGLNVRDWLYVEDHCAAIEQVLFEGRPGEAYNIGGACELTNREVVRAVCGVLDELRPRSPYRPHDSLITFVKDRPGHDRRYAIDSTKVRSELGWHPEETFETGLRKTVEWYLRHADWVQSIQSGEYQDWIRRQYGEP